MNKHEIKTAQPERHFSSRFGNYEPCPESDARGAVLKAAEDTVRDRVNTDITYQSELMAIVTGFEAAHATEVASFINAELLLNNFRRAAAHAVAQEQRRGTSDFYNVISSLASNAAELMVNRITVIFPYFPRT